MKKITLALLIGLFALSLTLSALAVERPKGLQDKGPITKITLIHYKKGYAKPPWAGGGGRPKEEKCYSFLSKGAKWKEEIGENYVVNPVGSELSDSDVLNAIQAGVDEWNTYGSQDVLGAGTINTNVFYDGDSWDSVNTASFGSYPDDNVIAVTTVWGYFYGHPSTREIVEWDMLFNTYWNWGDADSEDSVMDLQNIATHELGHSAGMGHPSETCTEETMYAYSTLDEIKKRDLHTGDILGIEELYN